MAYNNDILFGRITKLNGYEGAVTVKLEKIFSENIPLLESVFLEIEGRPVPFFISGSEYSGADILRISFEGYESVEKVSEFIGCRIFLTSGKPGKTHQDDVTNLVGYLVLVQNDNFLGTITGIIKNPGQWLLRIDSPSEKEILIPLHNDFIVSIDDDKKTIIMDIPDGLIDIN
jgi:16S rRNA processing protein RimM